MELTQHTMSYAFISSLGWGQVHVVLWELILSYRLPLREQTKNHFMLIMCPPPRKSLVKGERLNFIHSEGDL